MGLLDDISSYLPDYLPSDPQKREAAKMGLLSMGAAMLGANTRDFGRALGTGAQSGITGYQGAYELAQKTGLQQAQMKLLQNQDVRTQKMMTLGEQLFGGAAPQGSAPAAPQGMPMPSSPAQGNPLVTANPMAQWAPQAAPPAAPPQASQGGGFLRQMNPDQAVGWQMMGGQDLLPALKYAKEGTAFEQGKTYADPYTGKERTFAKLDSGQMQGANGQVANAPGYVAALAETAGAKTRAEEGAKAGFDLVDPGKFVDSEGRPILSTRAGLIGSMSPPKASLPPSPAKQRPAGFPVIAPQVQQERDGEARRIIQAEFDSEKDPVAKAGLGRELNRMGGPKLQSAAEAKTQLGAVDTTLKAGQGLNDNWIKEIHNPIQTEGKAANSTLAQLESIKHINLTTGSGTEFKAAATAVLSSLGLATKDMDKYLGNTQKFQQVAMERNMTMLQAQAGPQTDGDSQRAQQTFVKLSNTPAANQFIVDLTAANARMAKQKASYYNEALPIARARGDLTEIDRRWAKIAPSIWSDPALSKYKAK
jgi:hypothetical protein